MKSLVLADTHIPDGSGRALPDPVLAAAERADVILHAGDVTGVELVEGSLSVLELHHLDPI